MKEDVLWVQQILAGDKEVFHRLIEKYQSEIYLLVLSRVENPDDAQELLQEVFLEAYRDLTSLRQPDRFYAWLCQIARHQCQDWRRKRQNTSVPLQEGLMDEARPVDESIILQETLAKVMQAIEELPEMERKLLKDRYLGDASYAELQSRYKLSYKGVTMRMLRARQKLRMRLEKLLSSIPALLRRHGAKRGFARAGLEAVKPGIGLKIAVIGVIGLLILSGAGVLIHHSYRSTQKALEREELNSPGDSVDSSTDTAVKRPTDERETPVEEFLVWLDSLEKVRDEKSSEAEVQKDKDGNAHEGSVPITDH